MRELLELKRPTIETVGPLFHVSTLRDVIPGGPNGVILDLALLAKNPVLRARDRRNRRFSFVAFDPWQGQSRPIGNFDVPLELYAEVLGDSGGLISLIDEALSKKADPADLTALVQDILQDGYELSCKFVNILRQDFRQYYLRTPTDLLGWNLVCYYSKSHQRWYAIDAGNGFVENLLRRKWGSESEETYRQLILTRTITEKDLEGLAAAASVPEPSFADEMVYAALVELKHNRIRSAVVHAFIAYESAAKRGLETLLKGRLKGLESGAILEAITREVSTVTLGRIVLQHASPEPTGPPLDWGKIDAVYNTRNMVVHRGQRRMPPFEDVKAQVLEVWSFVMRLQAALRNGSASATSVTVADETLTVELSDGRTISVPLAWFPRLLHGSADERSRWRLIGQGHGLHWPDLDEDLSVQGLLEGEPSGESQRSFRDWLDRRASGSR